MKKKDLYTKLLANGKKVVVDSSKNIYWYREMVNANSIDIEYYNIVIWRKPLDYAYSKYRRNKMVNWKLRFSKYYLKTLKYVSNPIIVQYDNLVQDHLNTVKRIFDFVRIGYDSNVEEFWMHNRHLLFGSKTLRQSIQSGTGIEQKGPSNDEAFLNTYEKMRGDEYLQRTLRELNDAESRFRMPSMREKRRPLKLGN
jgi:hypothetical protein